MRVCQVVTGLIPIPNDRWGAVEKIIWNYKLAIDKSGHTCDVKYLNEVNPEDYDIVHIHMANLCLEAIKRNIPYVFSIHDHHAEYYGKGSFNYNQNFEAMKGSIFSITHAPHYLELFDEVDKLFHVPHGVDTLFFKPRYTNVPDKILMVANNGLAGDYTIDRKGFEIGIAAAKRLNIPITIVGADATRMFFELKPDLLKSYDKLNVICDDPTDTIVLEQYLNSTIFLHPSFLEAGHPNLTLLEAASCCLKVIATYKGELDIAGLYRIDNLNVDEVVSKIQMANANIRLYDTMFNNRHRYDWANVVSNQLLRMYRFVQNIQEDKSSSETKESLLSIYKP